MTTMALRILVQCRITFNDSCRLILSTLNPDLGIVEATIVRFVDGLGYLGLHDAVKANSKHLRYLFLAKEDPLIAQDLIDVFSPHFAEERSNRRHNEIRTYAWFRDFLLDVEGGQMQVGQSKSLTLREVLAFASGLEELPPLGFKNQPIIDFIHTDRIFPEANTCDVVLRLPIHRSYEEFCNHMCSGILQATEFGMTQNIVMFFVVFTVLFIIFYSDLKKKNPAASSRLQLK